MEQHICDECGSRLKKLHKPMSMEDYYLGFDGRIRKKYKLRDGGAMASFEEFEVCSKKCLLQHLRKELSD